MADRDFSIGEKQFKCLKIDAFKQFHIVRRLAPILGELLPEMKNLAKLKETSSELEQLDAIAKFAAPIMNGLSKLSDDDANKVLLGLLSAVEMKQANNWARLVVGDQLMFSDLDLNVLMMAAGRAFMFNMTGFFAALPLASQGAQ